jgi:hypothetical protein
MRKCRWRKWLGLAVLALALIGPPLAFGVSNLFLLSRMGRAYVAARIQRVIQLDTSVQGSSWSPWNGFTVYGLLIRQPVPLRKAVSKPMLSAESIRIHPDWRALAKRRIVIRSIEIHKPDLAVPIELLSQIPSAPVEPALAARPQDLAAVNPSPRDIPATAVPDISPPDLAPLEKQEAVAAGTPPIVTAPTFWIRIREGQMSIVSALTKNPLYRISRIDGSIPLGGKSAAASLTLGGIAFMGNRIPETVMVPMKWNAPVLGVGAIEGGIFGIACKMEAKIALTRGVPFLIGGVFPKQDGKKIVFSKSLHAKLGSVVGQGRIQGLLLAPGSWQGQGIVQVLAMETQFAGHTANFDRGQALAIFQGGALRCPDARLVGEEVSVLANGTLLNDGRFASIARIVASPEALVAISKFTQPDGTAPQLTALSTPQRAALDMLAFGFPGKVFFQPNPAAETTHLR